MGIRLYGMSASGNCWKPAALMRLLGQDFSWQEVDILRGESRTPEFLALNPNGRVPLLDLGDGRLLAESNAMLIYLAEGTPYLPADRYPRAKVFEWLFFEQYSHEPYIATVRFWVHLLHQQQAYATRIQDAMPKGHAALGVMEQQLRRSEYLVGDAPSIADIALFAYTHVADEGGYQLQDYPAIGRWMQRLCAQPGFQPMRA